MVSKTLRLRVAALGCHLTLRWSGRVRDKVPSSLQRAQRSPQPLGVNRRSNFTSAAFLIALASLLPEMASSQESPVSLTLRVKVKNTEFTNVNQAGPSAEPSEFVPFHYWWRYEAKVREVIRGVYASRTIRFAHMQPGEYRSPLTRDWLVELGPCTAELRIALGVELCVSDHALATDATGRKRIVDSGK